MSNQKGKICMTSRVKKVCSRFGENSRQCKKRKNLCGKR